MGLPTVKPARPLTVRHEPLTPSTFAPFGTVIASSLSADLVTYPSHIPQPVHPDYQPQPVPANQSTALKTSPISPLTNNYPPAAPNAWQGRRQPGTGLMSIFSSFPRQNTYLVSTTGHNPTNHQGNQTQRLKLKVGILERHPYTTQTFCPFNYSQASSSSDGNSDDKTYMLVLVAPTITSPSSSPPNPPDLSRLRAFLTPLNDPNTPNMAVTYAPGTWHAPMIVLGSRRVDFLVTQFANGVGQDDCQEVLVGSGPDEAVLGDAEKSQRRSGGLGGEEVEVDVSFLRPGYEEDKEEEEGFKVDLESKWTTDEAVYRTLMATQKAKL